MTRTAPAKQNSQSQSQSLGTLNGETRKAQTTVEAAKPNAAPRKPDSCLSLRGNSAHAQITDVEIYYGTMFGAAERFARALAHSVATKRGVHVVVHDLDGFDETTFARQDRLASSRVFLFVVSTHFAGAPPPSAERFRDWVNVLAANPTMAPIMKPNGTASHISSPPSGARSLWPFKRRPEPLRGMQYAVFAVGDSVYLTYNAMGKFIDLKLKQLGATRFHSLGLGNSSNGIDATFKMWETALLEKLPPGTSTPTDGATSAPGAMRPSARAVAPSAGGGNAESATDACAGPRPRTGPDSKNEPVLDLYGRLMPIDFRCRILQAVEVDESQLYALLPTSKKQAAQTTAALAGPRTPRVALFDRAPFADIEATEYHPGDSRDLSIRRAATFSVRLLNPETTYSTVTTLALFPSNSSDYVNRIAEAFGYDLDAVFELHSCHDELDLQAQQLQLPFPTPCTVRTALTEFLELRSLTPEFIRAAAGFVATSGERDLLEYLGSSGGSEAFNAQIQELHRGILELILLAPTLQIPLEVFVNIVPPIKPRYYSIASSPRVLPRDLDIAVSLGVGGQPQGLAVSFFERILALPPGTRVPFRGFVSWSRFQFQDDGVSPMIFITMGVGLSAMRSIIQDRLARWMQLQKTSTSSASSDGGTVSKPASRTIPSMLPTLMLFLGSTCKESVVFPHDLTQWEQHMMVKVHYTFSGDPRHPKRHVHEAVASRIDDIVDAVKSSSGSRIFVCGRARLVRRVVDIFEADQMRRGSRWFDAIQSSGRFIEEGYV